MDDFNEMDVRFEDLLMYSDAEDMSEDADESKHVPIVVPVNDDDSDYSDEDDQTDQETWNDDAIAQDRFHFDQEVGPRVDVEHCQSPIDYFNLFFNDELLDLIVTETNRYGTQQSPTWKATSKEEMRIFIGICLLMSIRQFPRLWDYWSNDVIFYAPLVTKSMTRDRYESLLRTIHFADNFTADRTNPLFKIDPVLKILNESFQKLKKPEKELYMDNSMVPFRERIVFPQFNEPNDYKYGINLFRLCSKGGYTQKVQVYAGKDISGVGAVAESVVLDLMESYLDQGRDLCADKWCTSLPLAETLVSRQTNLFGIIRKNRTGIPPVVATRKLKRDEFCYQQSDRGILLLKWKSKREILMLSTKHDGARGQTLKPKVVEDYNKVKGFAHVKNHMRTHTPFARICKWYVRLFLHLLTQTALVNAWYLFNQVKKMELNDFKYSLVKSLLMPPVPETPGRKRMLIENKQLKSNDKRRCTACYKKAYTEFGRAVANNRTPKVKTQCSECKSFICLSCYQDSHSQCPGSSKSCLNQHVL